MPAGEETEFGTIRSSMFMDAPDAAERVEFCSKDFRNWAMPLGADVGGFFSSEGRCLGVNVSMNMALQR